MKKANLVLMAAIAAAGVVGVAAGALVPVVAVAAETQKVSASVSKPLKAAQEAMAAKNWDEALVHIQEAQAVQPQSAYDTFMIDEFGWYVQLQKKDYPAAATMLEASVNSGFLAADKIQDRLKALTQINYQMLKNYPKAIEFGNRYLQAAPNDPDVGPMVAASYYQLKDYAAARSAAQKVAAASAKPSEAMLQIVMFSSANLNDRPATMQALEQLVRHYPKKDYWNDLLSNQLYETKGDSQLRTLYRLMYQTDTLHKAEDYSEMAGVLVAGGFPAEAVKVLEMGLAANVFSGDALTRAKATLDQSRKGAAADAKDLPNADKQLAAAKTGNEMLAIGKLYFSAGDYAKAADAIGKGLAKGGVTDSDDANALLGIALVRAGTPASARDPFQAVKDPKYAAVARLWVLYLDSTAPAAAPTATGATPPPG
ncbi:MAG: tetratricopeptide repeat protein [Steroidobacteraceae bacterium]